jgi:amidase
MGTTGGSIGLIGATSSRNAALVDRLLQAGMIVLAKANLTEFAGLKGTAITPGWSAVGGQTQSPFIEGGIKEGDTMLGHTAPGGSSTGPAVSVAAGFAPLAVGTETVGSVVLPAGRAGVYAFRAAYGSVPMHGVLHLTPDIDMIGTFGRCPEDLRELTACLQDRQNLLTTAAEIHSGNLSLGVAFADVKEWIFGQEVCPGDDSLQQQMVGSLFHAPAFSNPFF